MVSRVMPSSSKSVGLQLAGCDLLVGRGHGVLALERYPGGRGAYPPRDAPPARGGDAVPYELPQAPLPVRLRRPGADIDAETMQIHHDKHHQAYVNNLNNALEDRARGQADRGAVREPRRCPRASRTPVRNNGGGHANHSLFWQIMKPGRRRRADRGARPGDQATSSAVRRPFKEAFTKAAATRFGSGWAWLVRQGRQARRHLDAPTRTARSWRANPLARPRRLGARLLPRYQNRRPDYIAAWWNTVNWDEVGRRYEEARGSGTYASPRGQAGDQAIGSEDRRGALRPRR